MQLAGVVLVLSQADHAPHQPLQRQVACRRLRGSLLLLLPLPSLFLFLLRLLLSRRVGCRALPVVSLPWHCCWCCCWCHSILLAFLITAGSCLAVTLAVAAAAAGRTLRAALCLPPLKAAVAVRPHLWRLGRCAAAAARQAQRWRQPAHGRILVVHIRSQEDQALDRLACQRLVSCIRVQLAIEAEREGAGGAGTPVGQQRRPHAGGCQPRTHRPPRRLAHPEVAVQEQPMRRAPAAGGLATATATPAVAAASCPGHRSSCDLQQSLQQLQAVVHLLPAWRG